MQRGLTLLLLICLGACGGHSASKKTDGGETCDGGTCPATRCHDDAECAYGSCIVASGADGGTCEVECAVNSDCHSSEEICSASGLCVPASTTGSTTGDASSSGVIHVSMTGSTAGTGRSSGSSSGRPSSSSSASTSTTGSTSSHSSSSTSSTGTAVASSSSSGTTAVTTAASTSTTATAAATTSTSTTTAAATTSTSTSSSSSGSTFSEECAAISCPESVCEQTSNGVLCGVTCGSTCASNQLCESSPCTDSQNWFTAYCTPTSSGFAWSTSPSCDDPSNLCVTGATCQSGICSGGAGTSCAIDACHGDCVPSTGQCAINVGAGCDDANACTTSDSCQSDGTCVGSATGTPIHRYSNAAACDWFFNENPGTDWTDDGVVFRSAPGGTLTIAQLFDSDSIGRPLTDDPTAWSSVGSFTVEETDVVSAFSSPEPGAQKLIRYRFVAGSACEVSGWARYFSTIDTSEQPAGSTESDTPPGVATDDTGIWVCPP